MKILYFAHVARALGRREDILEPPAPADAAALWARLLALRPELAPFRASTRLARNGDYAAADERFAEGDEIALIPPVSGG